MVDRNSKTRFKDNASPQNRLTAKSYVCEKQTYNYQIAVMREPVSHQANAPLILHSPLQAKHFCLVNFLFNPYKFPTKLLGFLLIRKTASAWTQPRCLH